MSEKSELATEFEAHRDRLRAIAARVLGNRADAEDVVQEAWLRLARQEPGTVTNVAGWLTTVVGRLSIDVLRSRTAKHEVPLDEQLLDPVVVADDDTDPERNAIEADSVGLALLTVLGSLQPDERLAFVLHDLFALPFAEIGPIIGKSADAAKMTASRARRKVHDADTGPVGALQAQRGVVDAFLTASRDGDFDALLEILDPDVTWEVHGPHGVRVTTGSAAVVQAIERGRRTRTRARRVLVNGLPGILAWSASGQPVGLMTCTVQNGKMTKIASMIDRARLAALTLPPAPAA
jgi:RNA polymerase sigma-70 factor (ECF subfamily)